MLSSKAIGKTMFAALDSVSLSKSWCSRCAIRSAGGLVFFLVHFLSVPVYASSVGYAIIYPLAPDPYRDVFESIVRGVEKGLDRPAHKYEVVERGQNETVEKWMMKNNIGVAVSLGAENMNLCTQGFEGVKIVAGGILSPDYAKCNVSSGVALAPSPANLFDWLKTLSPEIETVSVVYNPEFNQWLIDRAKVAANARGIELDAITAKNLQQSAAKHHELIRAGIGRTHAVWLPQDPYTVDQNTILPELLDASWSQEFIVFSSNPAHVRRGVLFALYPDYEAMGLRLGRMAAEAGTLSTVVKKSGIEPLRDVLIAVNLRTADHLRLNLSNRQISNFDLTFPASR